MSKPKFPMVIKRGHTTVKIYRTPTRGCDSYTVTYRVGTDRQRKTFADLGLAITEAETVATNLSKGELNVLELKGKDQLAYARAVEMLAPTGISLEMAAIYIAEMYKILNGRNPVEAARGYAKLYPHESPKKTVAEAVEELVEAKEADKVSDVYVKDLKGRLGRFAEEFPGQISLVTTSEIERFLRELKVEERLPGGKTRQKAASSKTRNNYRGSIGTLFYFAESRGYVPKGLVDIESVAVAKEKGGDIEIFRSEELTRVLATADEKLIPFLTIGAFAGLRHAEIQRLDWSEVRLNDDGDSFIEVKAGKAKTAARRLVPIHDNLKAWLAPYNKEKENGEVCHYANMSKQLMWLAEAVSAAWQQEKPAGTFEWKHNALRHSFISYRVAETQNVAQTALEAGNSPRVVFSNYRELVRPADGKAWFSITPASIQAWKEARKEKDGEKSAEAAPSNIVPLPKAAGE